MSQPPQCCGEAWRFTHARPHCVIPVEQRATQAALPLAPSSQTWLAEQGVPELPQCDGSDVVSVQSGGPLPPRSISGAVHVAVQRPFAQ